MQITSLFEVAQIQRDRALIAVLLDTGISLGELASLKWPQIQDLGLRVEGKTGERTVPVSPHIRRLLVG